MLGSSLEGFGDTFPTVVFDFSPKDVIAKEVVQLWGILVEDDPFKSLVSPLIALEARMTLSLRSSPIADLLDLLLARGSQATGSTA